MNDRILGLLGLMRRAGKLAAGYDAVSDRIQDRTAVLIVLAEDTSEKTEKNISFLGNRYGVSTLRISVKMADIGQAIGKRNAGVLAVADEGFAKSLLALADQG